jgi:hypothetical protein
VPVPPSKAEKAQIEQECEEGTSKPSIHHVMEQRSSGGVVEVHKFSRTVIRVSFLILLFSIVV